MAVLKFDTKLSPWKGLDYGARKLDYFLVNCHKYNYQAIVAFLTTVCKGLLLATIPSDQVHSVHSVTAIACNKYHLEFN